MASPHSSGTENPGRGEPQRQDTAERVWVRCSATPADVAMLRAVVRRWLSSLGWPDKNATAFVHAVGAVCTNVVEHAYPSGVVGPIELQACLRSNTLARYPQVEVRDHGRWTGPDPHTPRWFTGQTQGLAMARDLATQVRIATGPAGTTVTVTGMAVAAIGRDR